MKKPSKTLTENYADLNKKCKLYKKAFELVCEEIAKYDDCPISYLDDDSYCQKNCKEDIELSCWKKYYLKKAKEKLEETKDVEN